MERRDFYKLFSMRKSRRGRRVSLYFDKNDVAMYNLIEDMSNKYGVTPGHLIAEMLKTLGVMSLYSFLWVDAVKKK